MDSDPHHFPDAGPNPADLYWYPLGINSKQMMKSINYTFSIKFQYAVQNTENFDTFEHMRKIIIKYCELTIL